jgi:ABC-type polysaccharide/polyol phosphate transport system ATPase subunit
MIRNGVTTVFVSHNLSAVEEISNRVLWLDHGEVISEGNPAIVINQYKKGKIPPEQ